MAIIRSLIERITLTPREDGTLEVLLYGELARILQFCEAGERTGERPGHGGPGRGLSVVAGARNHLCRTVMAWARPSRHCRRSVSGPQLARRQFRGAPDAELSQIRAGGVRTAILEPAGAAAPDGIEGER